MTVGFARPSSLPVTTAQSIFSLGLWASSGDVTATWRLCIRGWDQLSPAAWLTAWLRFGTAEPLSSVDVPSSTPLVLQPPPMCEALPSGEKTHTQGEEVRHERTSRDSRVYANEIDRCTFLIPNQTYTRSTMSFVLLYVHVLLFSSLSTE